MLRIVARLSLRARDDAAQVALDERDAGALHRDVGAGAHRDADVGLGQRRRVVDAVAGHRDDAALGLQPLDRFGFLVGQHLGATSSSPSLPRHGLGRRPVVAGEHDDAEALGVQERRSAPAADSLIGSAMPSRPAAWPSIGDEDDGLAVAAQLFGPLGKRAEVDPRARSSERRVADRHRAAVDRARRRPCR